MDKFADNLQAVISELNTLTVSAQNGNLASRGDTSHFQGAYRDIIVGVNNTIWAVTMPLRFAAEYLDRIAKGDIPERFSNSFNGDFSAISTNLNTCIGAVKRLVVDAQALSASALEGRLSHRADSSAHHGDFQKIVIGMNSTIDAMVSYFEVFPAPIFFIDTQYRIKYVNAA